VPEELNTLADHLMRRRLVLKLLQRQVAEQIGVDKASVANWEANRSKPGLRYMPAIIRFLGYNPLTPAKEWADRLVQCRTVMGLSQRETAEGLGVDQGTLARWERGERVPAGTFAMRAQQFVAPLRSDVVASRHSHSLSALTLPDGRVIL
jgi:transcriptional regulator with XRE-family HTH domain